MGNWDKISEQVLEKQEEIKNLNSSKKLKDFAVSQGWESVLAFRLYIKALSGIGIDYCLMEKDTEEVDPAASKEAKEFDSTPSNLYSFELNTNKTFFWS